MPFLIALATFIHILHFTPVRLLISYQPFLPISPLLNTVSPITCQEILINWLEIIGSI
jgi:hypothetical protein